MGSPGSPGALVGAKCWGNVVGFDCLILSQIKLTLTELCCIFIFFFSGALSYIALISNSAADPGQDLW